MRRRLIIAAHGSSVDPQSAAIVATLTARLRERADIAARFEVVEDRYLKQQPLLEDVVWGEHPTVVVPFFMAHGYFVDTVLTRIIAGRATISPALGTADFAEIVRDLVQTHASANVQLLLVAHGTERDARSGETALALAKRCDAEVGFIDQRPYLADALAALPDGPVAVLPFFAIPGPHTAVEIPQIVAASGRDTVVLPPVTLHPATELLLAELALR